MKEKEELLEKELNEVEVTKLPNKEFRVMVRRILKQFCENYTQINENCKGLHESDTNMKRELEAIDNNQLERNDIVEIKTTLERLNSRLEEAEK